MCLIGRFRRHQPPAGRRARHRSPSSWTAVRANAWGARRRNGPFIIMGLILGERCSLARAVEVVGERWTLLIVRTPRTACSSPSADEGQKRTSDHAERTLGLTRPARENHS
jgi:hypothetical protein